MRIRAGLLGFIAVFQTILFATHFFLYETWTYSLSGTGFLSLPWLRIIVGLLSVSFLAASLLAFRYTNILVRVFYRIAAVWLGLVSFLFFGAVLAWIAFAISLLAGTHVEFHRIVEVLYGLALLGGISGLVNASWTRVRRIPVQLENLPETWRGRTAALVSDLHLGHFRNGRFLKRI